MPSAAELLGPEPPKAAKPTADELLGPKPSASETPEQWAARQVAGDGLGGIIYHSMLPVVGSAIDYWAVRTTKGRKYAEALRAAEERERARFEKAHPYLSTAAGLGGAVMMPGMGGASRAISRLATPAERRLATIGLGGAMGAAESAERAGPQHLPSLKDAAMGFVTGAGGAGLLMGAAGAAGALGRGVDALTGRRISGALEKGAEAVRGWMGRKPASGVLATPAERAAARRMSAAAKLEKITPESVAAKQAERKAAGIAPGALQEVVESRGPVIRAAKVAARKLAPGSEMAREYAETKAANLPAEGLELVGRISPYQGTAEDRIAERVLQQSTQAAREYREPWATPVKLDEETVSTLVNPEVRSALGLARRTASLHGDEAQARGIEAVERYAEEAANYEARLAEWEKTGGLDVSELPKDAQALIENARTPEARARFMRVFNVAPKAPPAKPEIPEIPAGTLDRVRKAIRDKAESLMNEPGTGAKKDTHGLGVGLKNLSDLLDVKLEGIPELAEARAAYQGHQEIIEALRKPADVLTEKPGNFKKFLEKLPEGGVEDFKIAVRDMLAGKIQGDTGPAISLLRKLERGEYVKDNLEALLGAETATRLSEAAKILRTDLEKARFVSGVGESTTALNQADNDALATITTHVFGGKMHKALDWATDYIRRAGWAISPEEAAAIVKFSQGDPMDLLTLIKEQPSSPFIHAIIAAAGAEGANLVSQAGRVRPEDLPPEWSAPEGETSWR